MNWLGLDIGGANVKAADGCGLAISKYFPLWKQPEQLAGALREILNQTSNETSIAVTMTGELADCFATKAEGVRSIVEAVTAAAGNRTTRIYLTNGRFVSPEIAIANPILAAASNWHALARFASRFLLHSTGLVIDIGSTTTDIISVTDGRPTTLGQTDPERLVHGELVYTGVQRSPICALIDSTTWRNAPCPIAQEFFATTWDAYLTLGQLTEEPESTHTADGRPATRDAAQNRLARQICADRTMFTEADARAMSLAVTQAQIEMIAGSVQIVAVRLPTRSPEVIVSGRGEFLAVRVLEHLGLTNRIISLGRKLGPELSRVGPAHALAILAREQS